MLQLNLELLADVACAEPPLRATPPHAAAAPGLILLPRPPRPPAQLMPGVAALDAYHRRLEHARAPLRRGHPVAIAPLKVAAAITSARPKGARSLDRLPHMAPLHVVPSEGGTKRRAGDMYVCKEPGCGKSFARPYGLRVHGRKHSDEKPYVCREANCNERFKWRSSLSYHTKKRHKALPTATTPSN